MLSCAYIQEKKTVNARAPTGHAPPTTFRPRPDRHATTTTRRRRGVETMDGERAVVRRRGSALSSDAAADAAAARELHERVGRAVDVCRLFGLGLRLGPASAAATAADALLLAANAALCAYGFAHVTRVVSERMPQIWDATTVMSVAKVYTYLLSPAVTMAAWRWHGPAVVRAARAVHAAGARAVPLRPYARRAAAWYALSVLTEAAAYTVFHASTAFAFFSPPEYAMIAAYNVWTVVPAHAYVALVDAARLAVRRANARAVTAAAWRRRLRGPWKRLARVAVRLARRELGLAVVAFVVRTICEVVFYAFAVFIYSFPFPYAAVIRTAVNSSAAAFSAARMFEVFRVTHNCRQEVHTVRRSGYGARSGDGARSGVGARSGDGARPGETGLGVVSR